MQQIIEQLKTGRIPWRTHIDNLLIWKPETALKLHIEGVERPMGWDYAKAEKVVSSTHAKIDFGGNKALYIRPNAWPNPAYGDYIQIPPKTRFIDQSEYFLAMFHELTHWTECRMSYSAKYEVLELRAEIASSLLCTLCLIPCYNTINHDTHLPKWLELFEKDAKILLETYAAAQQAVLFLLSFCK